MHCVGLKSSPELAISVVTYRAAPEHLADLLSSIGRARLDTKVWVVDNSQTDRLRRTAADHGAVYLFPGKNIGFGAGHNLAFRAVPPQTPYHLVLNPDIALGDGVLEGLSRFMDLNPGVGWVMPRVTYPDGSEQRLCKRVASPIDLAARRLRLERWGRCQSRLQRYECRDLDLSVERRIPSLSGCFMFLRAAAFREVGGFDERYFLYMEDFDLARRMTESWHTVYYPHLSVRHVHAKGSYRNWKLLSMHMCSAVKYFNKWGWIFDSGRRRINRRLMSESGAYVLPEARGCVIHG